MVATNLVKQKAVAVTTTGQQACSRYTLNGAGAAKSATTPASNSPISLGVATLHGDSVIGNNLSLIEIA